MQTSRWLLFLTLLAPSLLGSRALRAQCLPLEMLNQSVAAGRITPDSLRALFMPGDWTAHPSSDNPYWTYAGTSPAADGPGEAWVGLRRSNGQTYYDLVYKTTHRECITQLRTELRRLSKLKSEYVNCVQCEAERLTGDGYTVTIFNQKASYVAKRTPYPYVLVLRRDVGGTGSSTMPNASSQLLGEH